MAGSINLANVALGFDSSKITKGVEISGGELRKLSTMFQGSISNVDKYNAAMELLDKSRKTGALTAERVVAIELSLANKYGIETEAIRAAAKAADDLARKKERQIALNKQLAANEQMWGDMLSHAQREMNVRQKKIEVDLQAELALRNKVAAAAKTAQQTSSDTGKSGGTIGSDIKSTLAQYAGMAAAFQGVKTSLSLAATAESNKIALEVLTGSTAKAQMLFEGFQELDRSSPLSRSDFSKASQTLIGYGVAAESTLPALRQLSEISIGNADRFQSLSLAFGQVNAQGRLMGQEVLQMVNAGFNPLQEISRTTGRSMIYLKKAMEDGAITSGMVADALKSATEAGGRFFEMNERLKNSAAGQWAKMQSDVQLLATEIGTNLMPAAKSFMDLLTSGADGRGGGGVLATLASAFSTGAQGIMAIGSDAGTNLAGDKKGTKFDELLDATQLAQMKLKLEREHLHVLTKEENEIVAKAMERRQAEKRKDAEDIIAREKAEVKDLADLEQSYKQGWKDYEEREKKRKMEEEFAYRESHIRSEFADRNKKELENMGKLSGSSTSAPTLKAGSVEAYKFLMSQKDKQVEATERHIKVSEESKNLLEKQLDALQHQRQMATKR